MATAQPIEKQASRQEDDTAIVEPLPAMDVTKYPDTDWPEKIAKAIEARRAGQEARKGKPIAFELVRSRIV